MGRRSKIGFPHRNRKLELKPELPPEFRPGIPITPEIADQLIAQGATREDIDFAISEGATYDPARNSLKFPPTIELF